MLIKWIMEFLPESEWKAFSNEIPETALDDRKGVVTKDDYLAKQTEKYRKLFKAAVAKGSEYHSHHFVDFKNSPMPEASYKEWLDYIAAEDHYQYWIVKREYGQVVSVAIFPLDGWSGEVPDRPYTKEEKKPVTDEIKFALRQKPDKDGWYTIRFSEQMRKDYLRGVLKEEGYFYKGWGDVFAATKDLKFAPLSDREKVYSKSVTTDHIDLATNSRKGKAVIYRYGNKYFQEVDGVSWSGEVRNGKIQGYGDGYLHEGDRIYTFTGMFKDGKPEGSCIFRSMPETAAIYWSVDTLLSVRVTFQPFREGFARVEVSGWKNYKDKNTRSEMRELAYVSPDFGHYINFYSLFNNVRDYEVLNDFQNGECAVRIRHGVRSGLVTSAHSWVDYAVNGEGKIRFTDKQFAEVEDFMMRLTHEDWDYLTEHLTYTNKEANKDYAEFKAWTTEVLKVGNLQDVWAKHPLEYDRYLTMKDLLALSDALSTTGWIDRDYVDRSISLSPHENWSPYDFVDPGLMAKKELAAKEAVEALRQSTVYSPKNKESLLDGYLAQMAEKKKQYADDVNQFVKSFYSNKSQIASSLDSQGVIDFDRCKEPGGELKVVGLLFVDYYCLDKHGEIWFKNSSDLVKYTAYYKASDHSFSHYGVTYDSFSGIQGLQREYKDYKDLIKDCVEVYMKKYYK